MTSPNRRAFLRAVGAGFATLPFFRLVENSFAQSMGEELPLKFAAIYHPHGIAAEYWALQDGETESSYSFTYENCSLAPLEPYRSKLLVVEGLEHLSNANGHDTAGTILTGSRINGGKPGTISLDQYLAVTKGLGSMTRVTSVPLAVGEKGLEPGVTMSYGEGGQALSKIIDPVEAFDLLFSGFVVGDDPAAQAALERQRALGKSVIDFVREDIGRLNVRLAATEKLKLDQHLTSLREIEKQFEDTGMRGASCMLPTRPGAFPKLQRYNGGEPYFDDIANAHMDILAQAFACDITRFATLYLADLAYDNNPLGLPSDNHGSVAHTYSASPVGANGRPETGNPSTWLPLASFNRYSYTQLARFLGKLEELGALDSSLVYATSDMGNPALHSTRNVPTVIAGGVNGKFRMGRRIKLPADCPTSSPWCSESDAVFVASPNNRLLVSILQAFGVEENEFGDQPSGLATGALSELV